MPWRLSNCMHTKARKKYQTIMIHYYSLIGLCNFWCEFKCISLPTAEMNHCKLLCFCVSLLLMLKPTKWVAKHLITGWQTKSIFILMSLKSLWHTAEVKWKFACHLSLFMSIFSLMYFSRFLSLKIKYNLQICKVAS